VKAFNGAGIALGLGLGLFGPLANSAAHEPIPVQSPGAPGEGVFCGWAIYIALTEVAAVCFPGENAAYQAELQDGLSRFDAYVRRNGSLTPAQITAFKQEHGFVGAPIEQLCKGPAAEIYRALENSDRAAMRSELDNTLAQPGEPTWGPCG